MNSKRKQESSHEVQQHVSTVSLRLNYTAHCDFRSANNFLS